MIGERIFARSVERLVGEPCAGAVLTVERRGVRFLTLLVAFAAYSAIQPFDRSLAFGLSVSVALILSVYAGDALLNTYRILARCGDDIIVARSVGGFFARPPVERYGPEVPVRMVDRSVSVGDRRLRVFWVDRQRADHMLRFPARRPPR